MHRDGPDDAETQLPEWAEPAVSASTARDPRQLTRGVAARAAGATAVAAVLFLLGHRWPAVAVVALVATTSVLALRSPAVGRATERFVRWLQRAVGAVLSSVLLGLFHLLVFVPVSLLLRVARRDPLAFGASPDDPTFWREVAARPGAQLQRRPFAYERHPTPRPRRHRLRAALGVLVILAAVDLGVGTLVTEDEPAAAGADPGRAATAPIRAGDLDGQEAPQIPVPDLPAAQGEPWEEELFLELGPAFLSEYHPHRGFTGPDIAGRQVNVTDGMRRSYEAEQRDEQEPIVVWFFGGSAMLGVYQRDEHTIPSELVKLAEADGYAVQAVNYGQGGYTIWQELRLLEERLAREGSPDLAVFYDGPNEILTQFRSEDPTTEPSHFHERTTRARLEATAPAPQPVAEPTPSAWRRMADGYADASALASLWRQRQPAPAQALAPSDAVEVQLPPIDPHDRPEQRGEAAARLHGDAVTILDGLGRGHGFGTAFFWQPWSYSKALHPGEEPTLRGFLGGEDPEPRLAATRAARAALDDAVVDLSDSLDGLDEPVMYDFVHTNEVGAQAIARAMYEELRPTLQALARRSGR